MHLIYGLAVICSTVIELSVGQQCPAGESAPDHFGDLPGEGVITFGIILPLRSPGADNQCGESNPAGLARLEAAVWAINNARTIFGAAGLKFGAYIYDGCGSPEVAAAATADYLSKRAVGVESCDNPPQYWPGIIGEFYSAASIAIAEMIEQVPVINQIAVSISDMLSDYQLFTRITPRAGRIAKTAMQLAKKLVPKSTAVTVVHGSDAAMLSTGLDSLDEARDAGLCVTGIYEADYYADDYSSIVDSILEEAEKGVKVVLLFLLGRSQVTFLNELDARAEAGNMYAKDLIVLNIAVDPIELSNTKPNIVSLRPYLELPPEFESYLLDTSQSLLVATEEWAAVNDCNTTSAECRQRILANTRATGWVLDQVIGFEVMMKGLIAAMGDVCLLSMCEAFTSMSAQEVGVYYQALEVQTLEYADNYQLPFVQAFENRERKDIYLVAWQNQKFENGSIIDIKIGEVLGDSLTLPDLELQTFEGAPLIDPTSDCEEDDCVCVNNPAGEAVQLNVVKGDVRLVGFFHHREGDCRTITPSGIHSIEALHYAVDTINAQSIQPGIKIGFDLYGLNPCYEDGSLPNLDEIIQNKNGGPVVGVVGPDTSSATELFFAQTAHTSFGKPPVISPSATSTIFNDKTKYPYFLRTVNDDTKQAMAIADLVKEYGWSHVMSLYSEGPYGEFGMKALAKALDANDIKMTRTEMIHNSFLTESSTESLDFLISQYTEQAYAFQANVSVIVLFLSDKTVAQTVLDSVNRQWNLTDKTIVWIAPDYWGTSSYFLQGYEDIAVGAITTSFESRSIVGFDNYLGGLTPGDRESYPWFGEYWQSTFKCDLPGSYRFDNPCDDTLRLPPVPAEQTSVPYVIDAVYAIVLGLHEHINKYCTGDEFCSEAEANLPNLIDSVKEVDFQSQAGWEVVFDALGNAPAKYDFNNFVKSTGVDSSQNYTYEKVGYWNLDLTMTEVPTAYIQPGLIETPVTDVKSTCEGDNCPYVEWWLYDFDYLMDQTENSTGRTASLFVNIYNNYQGNGVCSGYNPIAFLRYLAMKFVFEELKADMPSKATSILVCNPCGDKKLIERLFDTYGVVTFTDGVSDPEKNDMPSFVTAAGSDLALAINPKTLAVPLVHISSTSSSPYLLGAPNFARPVPSDDNMMRVIADLVIQLSPAQTHPGLLVLHDRTSLYSQGAYWELYAYSILQTPLCLSMVDIGDQTDIAILIMLLEQPVDVRGVLLLLPETSVRRILLLASEHGLSRKYFWIGTDTFPISPEPELHHVSLGAIRLQPYTDPQSDQLIRFKEWLNALKLDDLPKHPWSEQFWQSIFQCNLQADGGYPDGCVLKGQTFSDSSYQVSDTIQFSLEAAQAVAIINELVDTDYCETPTTPFQDCLEVALADPEFQNKTLRVLAAEGFSKSGAQAKYAVLNMQHQGPDTQAFIQVGTATPDDISFDLADFKFYDDEDRIVSYEDAFAMNCTNSECDCTNATSPVPRNTVRIIQGFGAPREDIDRGNAASGIISSKTVLILITLVNLMAISKNFR